jgi:hypothetical protein
MRSVSVSAEAISHPQVFVLSHDNEPNILIRFTFEGRIRNFNRLKTDTLSKTLDRIKQSVSPESSKQSARMKSKKKKIEESAQQESEPNSAAIGDDAIQIAAQKDITCELLDPCETNVVPLETTNQDAWIHGRILRIGEHMLLVVRNPPTVSSIKLTSKPLIGVRLRPEFTLLNAEEDACIFQWFRRRAGSTVQDAQPAPDGEKDQWEAIEGAASGSYLPTIADDGCFLRVELTPKRRMNSPDQRAGSAGEQPARPAAAVDGAAMALCAGERAVADSAQPAVRGPARWAGHGRHEYTAGRVGEDGVRVVTYNLLASAYADTACVPEGGGPECMFLCQL